MTCRALTLSCAQPKFFRGLSSSSLPSLAAMAVWHEAIVRPHFLARAPARAPSPRFRQQFEAECPGNRRGFHQLNRHRVAEAVGLARARADHGVPFFLVAEIFVANGSRGHESIGASLAQFYEQSCSGNPPNAPVQLPTHTLPHHIRNPPLLF